MTNKKNKLGNNPLDWIGKPINTTPPKKKILEEKRETFIVKIDLSEKIKDFAYWERMKQKEALNFILEEFFKDKNIKNRPQEE